MGIIIVAALILIAISKGVWTAIGVAVLGWLCLNVIGLFVSR
jgi:hypothetical protein